MWYDKSTREHRRRLLPSAMVKDNRSELEAEGGYLFLCCAMYSNRRFRAKTIATNPSCRFMSITSFLSEGEKTCSLRKTEGVTATDRQRPCRKNAARVCLPYVCHNKTERCFIVRCSQVRREISAALLLYGKRRGLSSFFGRVAHKKRRLGHTASKNGNGGGKV